MKPKAPSRHPRHAAARSRVVAGAMSLTAFLGLVGGLAARHASSSSAGATSATASMAATPAASSSGQTAITSSHGS
jgi:hypothetical protein